MSEPLTKEPKFFTKGETISWTREFCDYPADEWTLTYYFRGRINGFNVVAAADGTAYLAEIPGNLSNAAGVYQWQAHVTNADSERFVVDSGEIEILANLADVNVAAAYDPRTQAEIDLEAVRTMLSGKATKDVQAYTIGNRQLQHISIEELLKLEENLKLRVIRERRAKHLKKGGKLFKTVRVRLTDD
jgi:hypothetical protein